MKKPNHADNGQIRIIGGQRHGHKLPVPKSLDPRPTADRIHETLLNQLASSIVGVHCLNCFAGSGVLGLEALSRYAASTTLLEMEHGVAQQLQKDLATLKAGHGKVIITDTLNFLNQPGTSHQIIFAGPPFRQGLLEETLHLPKIQGWLVNKALMYVESEVEDGLLLVPVNWQLCREKVAGQAAYRLYQREARGEHCAD